MISTVKILNQSPWQNVEACQSQADVIYKGSAESLAVFLCQLIAEAN